MAGGYVGCSSSAVGLEEPLFRLAAGLDCWTLRRVLLHLARDCPHTLEAFLRAGLSPALAELLTSRFEAADAQLAAAGELCLFHAAFSRWLATGHSTGGR